jgi:hypothetical protein
MKIPILVVCVVAVLVSSPVSQDVADKPLAKPAYLGFDRNDYPGDASLAILRKTFAFTSYWLNNPPGAKTNTWKGKRQLLDSAGLGFVVIFNGKTYRELKPGDAAAFGRVDAMSAAQAARSQGFPQRTVIFLDQEEGGRLLPEQKAYVYAWIDGINAAGFHAGVYCSGMPFKESDGTVIVTAEDIRGNASRRSIAYWVANDGCPPSRGCSFAKTSPPPSGSGVEFADVWQFAQSPRRPQYTSACQQTYNADGNCYAPGMQEQHIHVDVDTASSFDPSHGRMR